MFDSAASLIFSRFRYYHLKPDEGTPEPAQGIFIDPYRITCMTAGADGDYYSIQMIVDIGGEVPISVTLYDVDPKRLIERVHAGEDQFGTIPDWPGLLR